MMAGVVVAGLVVAFAVTATGAATVRRIAQIGFVPAAAIAVWLAVALSTGEGPVPATTVIAYAVLGAVVGAIWWLAWSAGALLGSRIGSDRSARAS